MRRNALIALAALCAVSFVFMLGSSFAESAVVDELAHIPAGYAYLHFLDYRLNPEHPPLLKALAAVPLLFLHLNFPTENPFWTTAVNGEWGVGGALLYGLKNNADVVLDWARLFPILLTIGLTLFTYFWSERLWGPLAALLPAALVGFSPTFLAQGHYVTTDVAAAFGSILGLYAFARFADTLREENRRRTWKMLVLAGLAFGVAMVMKFSR